jgi:hypothetical protein
MAASQGINYRIYETTDPFTIEFMEQVGYPINGFEDCPGDPHTEYPSIHILLSSLYHLVFNFDSFTQREFMQKSMRPTRPPKTGKDPLRQFLDYDGKVLRFYCTLDDPRNRHEVRTFMLQFFLSDDTLSMVENIPPNCGRDPSPVFAKRQKPPKEFPTLEGMSTFLSLGCINLLTDIGIGQTITIFKHKFIM